MARKVALSGINVACCPCVDTAHRDHYRIEGVKPAGDKGLQCGYHLARGRDRVQATMRSRCVSAASVDCDIDGVGRGQRRTRPGREHAGVQKVRKTCKANAATGRSPAASSTPSSIMRLAPAPPSSAGWNMKITFPLSSSWRPHNKRAAPTSIAVCQIMATGVHYTVKPGRERRPCRLHHRQPSMSPRNSAVGPGRPPRRHPVTELGPRQG